MLWPANPDRQLAHSLVQTEELVGIRLPQHWILDFAQKHAIPLTTTSVNRTGEPPMRCQETLDSVLESGIDFLIDEGLLENPASTLVRCDSPEFQQTRR